MAKGFEKMSSSRVYIGGGEGVEFWVTQYDTQAPKSKIMLLEIKVNYDIMTGLPWLRRVNISRDFKCLKRCLRTL